MNNTTIKYEHIYLIATGVDYKGNAIERKGTVVLLL